MSESQHKNRLAKETSPYLLQHQHNPVDWYAWGPEAFEAARRENKPIFLSVGYSTCYWCHVMERQSFENPAIAAEMNQRFINIKVDREERADVDQLYMIAVQVLTRHGGWPMSVFLTPDLRPFYGGTYFPPADMQGRAGFVSVLRGIEDAYKNRPVDVEKTADQLVDILRGLSEPTGAAEDLRIDAAWVDGLIERSVGDYEPTYGGFGSAPKFPRETLLELLLVSERTKPNPGRMKMLRHALDAMAMGGIRDHLGGGFHRYSTDAKWLVPHFEIMLYDNAMLGWCYAEAFAQTGEERYAEVARGVFDFVLREMTSPEGAFYTAMDAEVDGREGLNYLWTAEEIEELLGAEDAELFNRVYGVDGGPNFADPHHGNGVAERNILFLAEPATAKAQATKLARMREALKQHRDGRKQPLLDTKIITSWNGLMIRALAHGGKVLSEQRYINAASRAADVILATNRAPDGTFYRTSKDAKAKYRGFLDDYAFLVQALLTLNKATGDARWRQQAIAVQGTLYDKFGDDERGGCYFTDPDASDIIIRQKTTSDSPLPNGNAVTILNSLDIDKGRSAKVDLKLFAGSLQRGAEGMSSMVQAALEYVRRFGAMEVAAIKTAARRVAPPGQMASNVVGMRAAWVSETELKVNVEILDGFHINAHDAGKGLIATTLAVGGVDGANVATIEYPPGERRRFEFAEEEIAVYEGSIVIAVRFKTPVESKSVAIRLTYQACDEQKCLAAVTKQIEIPKKA